MRVHGARPLSKCCDGCPPQPNICPHLLPLIVPLPPCMTAYDGLRVEALVRVVVERYGPVGMGGESGSSTYKFALNEGPGRNAGATTKVGGVRLSAQLWTGLMETGC